MAARTPPVKKRSERHAKMTVVKRDGSVQPLSFDKIAQRIAKLCFKLDDLVDADKVSMQVIAGLVSGITTSEIDQQAARVAAEMTNVHYDYSVLAARLIVADLHRTTLKSFSENVERMAVYVNPETGKVAPLVSEELLEAARKYSAAIDAAIVHNRDNNFTYFGLKTLMRSYLLKMNGKICERPQQMYMRAALGTYPNNIDRALELYKLLSSGQISMASPTMFNSGTPKNQLSSCFLVQMHGDKDSIDSFYETLWTCAKISKTAGGIGLAIHNVRAEGAYIAGTNGTSNGIVPLLRVFNATARYVDQGGNKRPGAFAIYLEPWHADVFPFLDLRKPTGKEEMRCHDLFLALWIPDLFMRRVEMDADWTLMCPHECPGLADVYGQEFEDLYTRYEREGKGRKTIPARNLWFAILSAQISSGAPYMLYKDSVNRKNMQANLGTIQCSNLCVAGDTFILTKQGARMIGGIADSHEVSKHAKALAEEKKDAEMQLASAESRLKKLQKNKKNASEPSHKAAVERYRGIKMAMEARLEKLKDVNKDPQPKQQEEVEVWNGKAWSKVTPVKTAEKARLWRVTTSHGTVLECTPDHKWILEDGTRVPTKELRLGSRLVLTPPVVYEGNPTHEQRPATAFRRGFTFAYGIMRMGLNPDTLGPNAAIKVGGLVVPKENVTKETLEKLGYDAKAMLKQAPEKDHATLAFMELPEEERKGLQDRLCGPIETRKAWVQGFMTAVNGKLDDVKGPYRFLKRIRMMFRSVGEDARLRLLSKQGVWQMHWPEKRDDPTDVPVVIGLEDLGIEEPTYCFTEPEEHAGVFADQLTGQCTEIVEYTSAEEVSVCNLASLPLHKHVIPADPDDPDALATYDFNELHKIAKITCFALNEVIDRNFYPCDMARKSNMQNRPIGMGVQGLADTFAMMRIPWETEDMDSPLRADGTRATKPHPRAAKLNRQIFETIYHAALEASCELAEARKTTYASYAGSPASQGKLQYDLWGVQPTDLWDWAELKAKIAEHGLMNSLLVAPMPTASTAQILGNNESFEPFTNNLFTRKVLAGEFQVVNKFLQEDLLRMGMWSEDMREEIIANNGSIQETDATKAPLIAKIPKHVKELYKTVWEISQRVLIDLSADRGAFVDQSQSFNVNIAHPTNANLSSMHFYGWKRGLKTGMYYLRTKAGASAEKVVTKIRNEGKVGVAAPAPAAPMEEPHFPTKEEILACSIANPGACDMCGA